MCKKISDYFAGVKMTIVSGVFLAISLVLMLTHTKVAFDPALVTVILSGYPLLYLAVTRLVYQKWVSSALLISVAMVASLAIGELFAAGEVAFIMAIGAILEDKTVDRAKQGLSQLIALTPSQGRRLIKSENGWKEEMIRADEIKNGDYLRVLPGEAIPVDGKVISGDSSVDQSIMTGESLPVDKGPGEAVFCGTMNCLGSIDIEATAVGEDSSLQKMIRMVEQADEKKAPIQRIADQWSVWLVPIALLIAIGGFLVNWALGLEVMDALERGVTVLVVFCPCALALATPTTIMAAIGQATKHGVIIKSGAALEAMGKVDTIAFDKTGTLTLGKLEVSDVVTFSPELTENQLLAVAAAVEVRSEHPLGKAVVAHAKELGLQMEEAESFRMEAGRGIEAVMKGHKIFCGNEAYLNANTVCCNEKTNGVLEKLRNQGKAIILVAAEDSCLGVIALTDSIRPDTKDMISELHTMGTRSVLLTGDNKLAAQHFASRTGMTEIRAELLPEEKVKAIDDLQNEGRIACMIGDGVNDAPALKTASVGVAMGSMGSDIAVEAADIALMRDDISQVVYLKRLALAARKTIKANLTASLVINAIAVTLSVIGILTPVTGALVHNAGSVLVVLNAALLYDRKFE